MKKQLKLLASIIMLISLAACSSSDGGSAPQEQLCSSGSPDLCTTTTECSGAGGHWYSISCHSEPANNWDEMSWNSGQWN